MKIIITFYLLAFSLNGFSQSTTKYYFDEAMHPTSKKKADIFGTGEMDSGLYKLSCYYVKRKNPIACVAHFTDSTQNVHEGGYHFYFENGTTATEGNYHNGEKEGLWINHNKEGRISDSVEFKNGMALKRTAFYDVFANNQKIVTVDDLANNKFYTTLYDSRGNVLSNEEAPQDYSGVYFYCDTACTFPDGPAAWQHYISKAIMDHINDLSDDDYGTVLIRFVVDSDGKITDVSPLTMKTSRLAMIAFNAIDGGPKWEPAVHNGKKVKTIRIQPVTIANPK